jgi:hypothetical protein
MNTPSKSAQSEQNQPYPFTVPAPEGESPTPESLIESAPMILNVAIEYILQDFDYLANPTANTAIAVRILATFEDRISRALESSNKGGVQ